MLLPLHFFGQRRDDIVKIRIADGSVIKREYVVKGSPYLYSDFKIGEIAFNGKNELKSLMRYNVYRDYFELLDNNQKQTVLQKNYNVQALLNGISYQYIDYLNHGEPDAGYFTPLNKGLTVLYSRVTKKVSKYDQPDHGYEEFSPPEFIDEFSYYIKRPNRPARKIELNKRDVPYVLDDKFAEIRAYVKKNKLKLKTEEEVIQVLAYYDSLYQEKISN